MSVALIATALAGAGAGVGSYYASRTIIGPNVRERGTLHVQPSSAELLARFARRDGKQEKPREYMLTDSQPSGSRQVPILPLQRTATGMPLALPLARYPSNDKAWITQSLRNARAALVTAGRGAEDVRCSFCLTVIETGWGKCAWNHDYGNVKGTSAYWGNPSTIRQGFMWTRTPESTGCYVLVDRVRSLDCYHAFADWAGYARYQRRLFTEYRAFRGVCDAWQVGGLNGLLAGEDILAKGGYSGTGQMGRRADARAYWARMRRLFPNWETRSAWNG
jgi:hypothetical protein